MVNKTIKELTVKELYKIVNTLKIKGIINFETYHWIKGVYFNIPICCILQFIAGGSADSQAEKFNVSFNFVCKSGYVPCDECMERRLKKEKRL